LPDETGPPPAASAVPYQIMFDGIVPGYALAAGGGGGGGGDGWTCVGPGQFVFEVQADMQAVQAAIAERNRAEREHAEAWAARSRLAEKRLGAWLSEEQARCRCEHGWFPVTGSDGTRWRILATGGVTGNVLLLGDDGKPLFGYCAHPCRCPPAEAYLAQALAIQSDVERFLKVANLYHDYRPPLLRAVLPVAVAGEMTAGDLVADVAEAAPRWTGLLEALRGLRHSPGGG